MCLYKLIAIIISGHQCNGTDLRPLSGMSNESLGQEQRRKMWKELSFRPNQLRTFFVRVSDWEVVVEVRTLTAKGEVINRKS